ncbi:MAG: hypothetical protein ABIE42_05735 [Candidatus Eisenbacteria bacterium]
MATYLVPTYLAGEYEVAVIDKDGKISDRQTVSVLGVAATAAAEGGDTRMANIVDRLFDKIGDLEKRLDDPSRIPPPPKTAKEQLEEAEALKKTLGGGGDPMFTMIMNQQAEDRRLLMEFMREQRGGGAKSDLDELRRELRELRPAPGPALPPPDTLPQGPDIGEIIRDVLAATRPVQPATPPDTDRMGPKDWIDLIREAKDIISPAGASTEVSSLRTQLEGLRTEQMKDIRDELREMKTGGGPTKGIDDALSLVDKITTKFGGGGATTGDRILQGIEMFTDPDRLEAMGGAIGRTAAAFREGAAGSPKPPRDENKKLRYPAGFSTHVKAIIDNVDDDTALVTATMRAVEFLGKFTSWQGYVLQMVKTCQENNRDEALAWAKAFIQGLRGAGKISQDVETRAIAAFEDHADEIMTKVRGATQPSEE